MLHAALRSRKNVPMSSELKGSAEYLHTMEKLEAVKKINSNGVEYWLSRDINGLLGYPKWSYFEAVILRARDSFVNNNIEPSHHILETQTMMELGGGGKVSTKDYFLTRPACYLVAMNGDPSKQEIAAAQAYFTIQTRLKEKDDQTTEVEKRLEIREKVTKSFKRVSGAAQQSGVRSTKQAVFHDARYQGLYGMSAKALKSSKGLADKDQLFDRAGFLELSAHEFQMNLAADVLNKENIKSESTAIQKNREIAQRVRKTISDSGATLPEKLPLEKPIKEIKRLAAQRRKSQPPD